jgi:lysylphosphatidylglycerol synthetase-like protein (DUF2156 family)
VTASAEPTRHDGARESVAGFLAALAIFMTAIAILVALVAVGMAQGRSSKLAGAALIAGGVGWVLGMTVAIAASRPLF